jgi:hypothetical protein
MYIGAMSMLDLCGAWNRGDLRARGSEGHVAWVGS